MKTAWTKGVPKEEVAEVKAAFEHGARLRDRLSVLINDKVKAADTASMSKDGYDCANWAYKQADYLGYKRALSEILSLLEK